MKEIIVIIEKADDGGYSAYAKDIPGLYGYGLTEEEAKTDFLNVYREQAEYHNEKTGVFPDWYSESPNIEYQ